MENLPTELLPQIFALLHQEDHIQCVRTCRLWKSILEEVYLFQTMTIYSDRLNSLSKKATECKRQVGRRIERVQLFLPDFYSETDFVNHLQQYPNIRKITCIAYNNEEPSFKEAFFWHKSIESIIEVRIPKLVQHLLTTSVCPNLTKLVTSAHEFDLIRFLKNAPNLRHLTLDGNMMALEKLNQIHENVPNLKRLVLWCVLIDTELLPTEIRPAPSLTALTWKHYYCHDPGRHLNFLRFIILKYPNLMEFVNNWYPMFHYEHDFFELGYKPLIKALAPSLRKLHLCNTGKDQYFLEILDSHNCQIHDLSLQDLDKNTFPRFEQSRQAQYIRKLLLCDVKITSMEWLKELNVLESLDIQTITRDIPLSVDFNEIIDHAPPTLTSLKLSRMKLRSKLKSSRQTNIETLAFDRCNLPHEIGMFIDRHFPVLSKLEFNHCIHTSNKLILRSIGLDSLLIADECNKEALNVLVHTTLNNNDRWYSTREKKYYEPFHLFDPNLFNLEYPPVKSQPAEDLAVKPDFILSCYRLNQIFLCR